MPIDPAIPLSVTAPQVMTGLQAQGQVTNLRDAMQRGLLTQQQIQATELENQQRQMDMASQKAIQQSFMDAKGDQKKFLELAQQHPDVLPRDILALQQHQLGIRKQLAEASEIDNKLKQAQFGRLGSGAQAILRADPVQKSTVYASIVHGLVGSGDLKPDEMPATWQEFQQNAKASGQSPDAILQAHVGLAKSAHDQIEEDLSRRRAVASETRASATAGEAAARTPLIQAQAEEAQRKNAATKLAGTKSDDEYTTLLNALPHGVAQAFPSTRPTDPQDLLNVGMTPAERSSAEHRGVVEDQADQRIQIERDRAARENAQTQNSAAVDRRQAQRAIDKLVSSENNLNRYRKRLGNALSSLDDEGNPRLYVDRLGNTKPMVTAAAGDPDAKAALAQEMEDSYRNASDELGRTISEKNQHFGFLGTNPRVSTEQAHADIAKGDEALFANIEAKKNPKPAAGAPPAPAKGAAGAAPPITLLKPNVRTTLKNPATGQTEVWTLQNGKAVKQ